MKFDQLSTLMNHREFLLHRVVTKTATKEEILELFQMMSEEGDPYEDELLNGLVELLQGDEEVPEEVKLKAQKLKLERKIISSKASREVIPIYKSKKLWWSAAAAVGIMAVGIGLYESSRQDVVSGSSQIASSDGEKERSISVAGKQFVVLPDSSTVLLNEGSKLTYSTAYGKDIREVILTGEGFFDVMHDPEHKFIVRSSGVTTSVLGTAFNVKAYENDHQVVVTVARGKVAVADDHQAFGTITPNEQIAVNTDSFVYVRSKVNAAVSTAWADKFIIINNQRFEDAIALVASRFNVKIKLENADLRSCRINAAFLEEHELKDVLTALSTLANASWTMKNGSVTISGGGCK